jgi:transcription elongation factor SPT6
VLAKKIAKDALDDDQGELDKDECVSQIMKNPNKLEDLDLEDYANHLSQVKNKHNMIHLLRFIVRELTLPFEDPRNTDHQMKNEDLFYKLCKESPQLFKENSFVFARIHSIKNRNFNDGNASNRDDHQMVLKITDNNLFGTISRNDISNSSDSVDFSRFHNGQVLRCRVKKIDYEKVKVFLSIRPEDMKTDITTIERLFFANKRREFEQFKSYFLISINKSLF